MRSKKFYSLVDSVISDNRKKFQYEINFSDLDEVDQEKLVSAFLNESDEPFRWLFDSKKANEINFKFTQLLTNQNQDNRIELASALQREAIKANADYLQEIINQRIYRDFDPEEFYKGAA